MKVRTDFVTNSSSVSFGVALTQSLLSVLGTLTAVSAVTAAETAARTAGESVLSSAEEAAKKIAESAVRDAERIEAQVDQAFSGEELSLNQEGRAVRAEIEAYQEQWKTAQEGADPKDPGFQKLKEQYDAYFEHLKGKLADLESRKYELQVVRAQEEAAGEAKNEWVRGRQQDLIAVLEERSLLEASVKGYGQAGYDVKAYEERLKQIAEREQELRGQLRENNADIEYTARDRGVIGPGKEFDKINREYQRLQKEKEEALKKTQDAQERAALESRMQEALKELEEAQRSAARWDMATKAAEGVQFGADLAVDALANVTGPAGKTIRKVYMGAKGVAGGIGEGMASGDLASNIGKGMIKGASDVIKDTLGDKEKYGKYAKGVFTIVSETGQGALDSYTKGEGVWKGGFSGLTKGVTDASADKLLDKYLPSGDPLQADWGQKNIGAVLSGLRNRNPLTMALGKSTLGATLKGAATDQAKNLIKGDDVIFSGWSTSFSAGGAVDYIAG